MSVQGTNMSQIARDKGGTLPRPGDRGLAPVVRPSNNSTNSSLMNINDLPLPVSRDVPLLQAAVFIEDGVRYRSIQHKIDPISLKIYQVYYSRFFQWLLKLVLLVLLMLAFFEYPTTWTLSSDFRFRNQTWHISDFPCGVTESIEMVCLIFISCDCLLRFYLGGWRRFVRKPWYILYAIMIVLSVADLLLSLSFCNHRDDPLPLSLVYTLRIRRYFRPIFFLISSTIMKKFAKAIALTLPQIFTVLVLLAIHLYVFAMIGLLAFPHPPVIDTNSTSINSSNRTGLSDDILHPNLNYSYYVQLEGEKYFSSVSAALESLLVLLTTANHPDVMMPIYQYNRFSAIYFILFLGVGAYIILNLLIAVIYNHFKGFFQNSLQSSFLRRRVAFRAAFTVLVRKTQDMTRKSSHRGSHTDHVSKDLIRDLLQRVKISNSQKPLMYHKLETVNSQFLNWQQFREVFDLISKDTSKKRVSRVPYYSNIRALQWFQFVIRHRFFAYFTHFVSIVNVAIITIQLEISYDEALGSPDSVLAASNLFFVAYYVLEQILKMIGFGCKGYFRSIGNCYEGLLTVALVVLEIVSLALFGSPFYPHSVPLVDIGRYDIIIRLMNIFIVLRLLRILAHVQKLKMLTATIFELIRNLRGFAGIILVIYYLFALLGMQLFIDVNLPSNDNSLEKCGTYDNLRYFANNFHDFGSSLVVLWDVMVVNNWFIFLDKFGTDSFMGNWAKLYFIAWWLVAVIIFVNLFISLVLETFLVKWEAVHQAKEENSAYDETTNETWERQSATMVSQISDIHNLLRAQLVEPEESRIMHELQRHHDLMLV